MQTRTDTETNAALQWLAPLVVILALAACSNQPPPSNNAYCATLFDQLDAMEFVPQPQALYFDFRQTQLARIRQAGCITFTRNLVGMEAVAESLISHERPAGLPLRSRVAVQAGVVTNPQDEARALAFFEGLGYRVRSVGWPELATRVYVEALTVDQIGDIVSLAQRAGFVGPYASRWVTF
jgi:hypothetical protein